jgi:hypothetical protein
MKTILSVLTLASLALEAPAIGANLEFQEKCSNRSRDVLVQLRQDGEAKYSRQNHYSEQLQKCFIWVGRYSSDNNKIFWAESLLDAFEGKSYGEFMFRNDLTKKSKQAPTPEICYVDLPEGTERCENSDVNKSYFGFVRLISVYLEMP